MSLSNSQNQSLTTPSTGGVTPSGERKEALVSESERIPVVERPTTPEVPPKVEHVEAISAEEIALPQPVVDDTGAVVMDNAAPQQVTITLPLTDDEMNQALHLKIIYSLRWLAEWMKRLIKIVRGKFIYRGKQVNL